MELTHDSYGVFSKFLSEKLENSYSKNVWNKNTVKKLIATQNNISLILKLIMINKINSRQYFDLKIKP